MATFKIGDHVVYRKSKMSDRPGPRAEDVHPSHHGEEYAYLVDKYWTVVDKKPDGTLVLATRKGKLHEIAPDDPNLRKAGLREQLLHGKRFPELACA